MIKGKLVSDFRELYIPLEVISSQVDDKAVSRTRMFWNGVLRKN
jgi:hypothetical protein